MHFNYTSVNFKIIPNFVVIISNPHWWGRGFNVQTQGQHVFSLLFNTCWA